MRPILFLVLCLVVQAVDPGFDKRISRKQQMRADSSSLTEPVEVLAGIPNQPRRSRRDPLDLKNHGQHFEDKVDSESFEAAPPKIVGCCSVS